MDIAFRQALNLETANVGRSLGLRWSSECRGLGVRWDRLNGSSGVSVDSSTLTSTLSLRSLLAGPCCVVRTSTFLSVGYDPVANQSVQKI